ncbi:MAG: sugar phosphate isomerase/epimerase [Chitinophagaceae bacterium]|nr:sugar phosphate isomerase/epimerase [Chitinophagaceae bacterium]MCW5925741.1 sugar phosphate isomerase/epimerase [Chitinophagaceae bacterium]
MLRRKFIQSSAMILPATGLLSFTQKYSHYKNTPLDIGIAGYTFVHYSLDDSIAIMKRLNIRYLSVKDFHLPLDSSPAQVKEILDKYKAGGIEVYTVGVIYMKTEAEVDRAFDYAKRVGVNMIVGVPTYDLLNYTEKKVRAYDIKMAIHNHGPEDKLYPGPDDIYNRINKMDKRMGICLDIGHALRAGSDLVRSVKDFAPRIFDLHIKDVSAAQADAKSIEAGRGAIEFKPFVDALRSIGYTGKCSIEYEKDMKDLVPGLAESIGYFRGIMAC